MKVLKFGGSSVATPERIRNVIKIVEESLSQHRHLAVVFSAFGGVTDKLIEMANLAISGEDRYQDIFGEIEKRHMDVVKALVSVKKQSAILANVKMTLNELSDLLHGIYLVKELTPRTLDFVMSFGERLSAYIISESFNDVGIPAEFLDARDVISTDDNFGAARVNFDITNKNIHSYFKGRTPLQIITGFIAYTENKETTTLGRSGSDYTAAIFGAALKAKEIEIWTDVDGMMTADPRKVKKAFPVKSMSYKEAMEISHFGAKVIYPATMQPAMRLNIPIRIKNTFNPSFEGTLICAKDASENFIIKGISSIPDIALLSLQGSGMMGMVGVSMRLFTALARKKINVILISQASSEYSICFAVDPKSAMAAKKEAEKEFTLEIKSGQIEEVIIEKDKSVIAVVGENMRNTPGITGRMFHALGKNGINVSAVAQGSSELNISAVIDRKDEAKALNTLHEAFFLSDKKSLYIYLVGVGLVGNTLLSMIKSHFRSLSLTHGIEPHIIAVANSRKMFFEERGINPAQWKEKLNAEGQPMQMKAFVQQMKKMNLPNSVFVDCTASEEVAKFYTGILETSISIVTPNKKANSGSYSQYLALKAAASKYGVRFLYETNVGAGLPVINTLGDLLYSGDNIRKIEAVLSGTLSFIFNTFKEGISFSAVVKEAKEKGYTEPDPRDDLNGMDVARKLLILARESGQALEMKDIHIENILPESCRKAPTVEAFFKALEKADGHFDAMRLRAEKKGCKLRFIASLEKGNAKISLQEVDAAHPFYSLSGSDNIISYTTDRYKERPLVIKGPGAGAEVTAAGVFADIIRIASHTLS